MRAAAMSFLGLKLCWTRYRQTCGVGMNGKSKGGRPPAPPGLRRVNVPLRLPEWLVQWMAEEAETPAELIEAALLKAHKLRPPRAP